MVLQVSDPDVERFFIVISIQRIGCESIGISSGWVNKESTNVGGDSKVNVEDWGCISEGRIIRTAVVIRLRVWSKLEVLYDSWDSRARQDFSYCDESWSDTHNMLYRSADCSGHQTLEAVE